MVQFVSLRLNSTSTLRHTVSKCHRDDQVTGKFITYIFNLEDYPHKIESICHKYEFLLGVPVPMSTTVLEIRFLVRLQEELTDSKVV